MAEMSYIAPTLPHSMLGDSLELACALVRCCIFVTFADYAVHFTMIALIKHKLMF